MVLQTDGTFRWYVWQLRAVDDQFAVEDDSDEVALHRDDEAVTATGSAAFPSRLVGPSVILE